MKWAPSFWNTEPSFRPYPTARPVLNTGKKSQVLFFCQCQKPNIIGVPT